MTQTTTGWMIFIAAMGMMAGLLSVDLVTLKTWHEVWTPEFIGGAMGHFAVVVTAFVGGKLIPQERDAGMKTRAADNQGGSV